MDEQAGVGGAGDDRAVLGLQRVLHVLLPLDDRAGGGEGVRAEVDLRPVDDVRDLVEDLAAALGLLRVHGYVDRRLLLADRGAPDLVRADPERGEIARHRLGRAPHERRTAVLRRLAAQLPVGDGLEALRDGDGDVVRRLVRGVVVAGEPGHRACRFAERERPVGGRQPALVGAVGVGDPARLARVTHRRTERPPLLQGVRRPDDQLLALPFPPGLGAVDGHGLDVHALQVQVEGAEVLLRPGRDDGLPVDMVLVVVAVLAPLDVHVEGQGVVRDVVAAVAELREVRVPQAGRTARADGAGSRPLVRAGGEGERQGRGEQRGRDNR